MKIEEIAPPNNYVDRTLYAARCSRKVRSTGTSYFNDDKTRCARLARFKIDGIAYCFQHAGEAALRHLISKQEAQP